VRIVPVDLASSVRMLVAARAGSVEILGVLAGEPLLVVDLDSGGDAGGLRVPATLPAVVVGVSRTARVDVPVDGVDIALTESAGAGAPWVVTADLGAELRQLADRVAASPAASVTAVQVLRSSRPSSIEADLILESLAYSTLQSGPEFGRWKAARPMDLVAGERGTPVLVERVGARLTITLNRPEVRNAYSAATRDDLCEALSFAAADAGVTDIRLKGAGASFCSGGDLREFATSDDPATAHLIRTGRSAGRLLAALAGRVTVDLHGSCIGAGIELPAFAHRVLAAPDTRIQLPEVAMGLIPGAGGTASIPRRIGRQRTAWLAVTGQVIDAPTALAWGLVDALSP
jgi:enoyl-CoA hydratase/carnithine racemase